MIKKTCAVFGLCAALVCVGCAPAAEVQQTTSAVYMNQLDVQKDEWLADQYQQEEHTDLSEILEVSQIFYGSFTKANSTEELVLFRFSDTPTHVAGADRVIAAVYDVDTQKILAQGSFDGDQNRVYVLQNADGLNDVLLLADKYEQGTVSQQQKLFCISDGAFSETDPLTTYGRSEESIEFEDYSLIYCTLIDSDKLLLFDIIGTWDSEQSAYDLKYSYKDTLSWNAESECFEVQ
jgi:hypothetical protein